MLQINILNLKKKRFIINRLVLNCISKYKKIEKIFKPYIKYTMLTLGGSLKMHINLEQNHKQFIGFFQFLKKGLNIKQLLDVVAIDSSRVRTEKTIQLQYVLLDVISNIRFYFVFFVDMLYNIPSLMHLYKSAAWLETEVYEFFGIIFTGHLDLRHLILDYGVHYMPGLKSFPVIGYTEFRYSELLNIIVQVPVTTPKEFSFFTYERLW